MAPPPQKRYTIGHALSSKKQKTLITPSLLSLASSRGLDLIPIDPWLPISSQFTKLHLILHKLYDDAWISKLEDFAAEDPSVPIIDRPELIERLQDRISMLRFVSELQIPAKEEATFGIPNQITIDNANALSDPSIHSGLNFPIISKPLASDGSTGSHKMALIFNHNGLLKQTPPLVLQEFINHGGIVFKVYVVEDYVKCVKRKSLPDLSNETLEEFSNVGSVSFSLISNLTSAQDKFEEVEMPPECFVMEIAKGLRSSTRLHLFNFDMIRDQRFGNRYLVIDINYFPGYEKLPGFETVLTDFLWSMVHKEQEGDSCSVLADEDEKGKPLCNDPCGNKELENEG